MKRDPGQARLAENLNQSNWKGWDLVSVASRIS